VPIFLRHNHEGTYVRRVRSPKPKPPLTLAGLPPACKQIVKALLSEARSDVRFTPIADIRATCFKIHSPIYIAMVDVRNEPKWYNMSGEENGASD
jgi:hypothetical protein